MSKGLKRSSISPPCMSRPITRKPMVSCGICGVRHSIVDWPTSLKGLTPDQPSETTIHTNTKSRPPKTQKTPGGWFGG